MNIKTYIKGKPVQLSKNFKSTEFDCHGANCCKETQIDDQLVEYLQKIREHFNKPVKISSGYRCKTHNARVGGASKSNHMYGQAADTIVTGVAPIEVARYAESIGVLGIGVYNTFVHIDTRKTKYFWYDGGASNVATFAEKKVIQKKSGYASSGNDEDIRKIWNFLSKEINNPFGVAALMGNLYAESALRSNNLQDSYEKKLGFNDEGYTEAVDNETYPNFVKDAAGYGLAQWTYHTRKQGLLNFATKENKSIGDYETQLSYLIYELNNSFKSVMQALKEAKTIREASDIVLIKFEAPANQSESVKVKRAQYGQVYYDKFCGQVDTTTAIKKKYAVANTAMHVREKDNILSKSLGIIAKGAKVEVLEAQSNGWYKISWNGKQAYTSNTTGRYYSFVIEPYTVKITANVLNIRAGAGTNYKVVGYLKKDVIQTIIEEKDGWGKLKSEQGWIKLSYSTKV